jgi:hypothetical protein
MRKPYDDDIRRQPVMSQALAELIAERHGVHPRDVIARTMMLGRYYRARMSQKKAERLFEQAQQFTPPPLRQGVNRVPATGCAIFVAMSALAGLVAIVRTIAG